MARGFYALKNTKTPVIVSIIAVTINIIFSLLLTKIWKLETYGLALANSLADAFNSIVLLILLSKKLKTSIIDLKEIVKFFAAAVVMFIAVNLTKGYFDNLILQTIVSVVTGVAVYFSICFLLRSRI